MGLDAFAHGFHHFQVDADEIIPAHAGLPRYAGGDDADVSSGNGLITVGARKFSVKAFDGA